VLGHERTNSSHWGVSPEPGDLAVTLDTVVLERLERNGLVHTLGLLWLGVNLLLTLLSSSAQAQHKVKGGLLLDVVVAERAAIFELLSSKNQTLLIWRNSFLVLDLGLDILNAVGSLNIKRNSFAYKRDAS
jgi:hypothetical protein